ncbi:hypothetical protein C2845_PM01G12970 [Panicum miliaceum]|uniref:Uncharacterized protein n=1 Tax=Panicum miliaceum TaxID=4540 RepID=A0A3L6TNF9_PANMI|nr:hypothetical protein C2845_PM01G12970 [Panicum miliaceum]
MWQAMMEDALRCKHQVDPDLRSDETLGQLMPPPLPFAVPGPCGLPLIEAITVDWHRWMSPREAPRCRGPSLVRFLAVCRPWREAPPPPHAPSFLPCLVEPCGSSDDPGVRLYSPFSTRKTRSLRAIPAFRGKTVERSDACSGRVLAVGRSNGWPTADLINPLNGDATSLPPRPRRITSVWRSWSGVVSRSGVVVFHTNQHVSWRPSCCGPASPTGRKSA